MKRLFAGATVAAALSLIAVGQSAGQTPPAQPQPSTTGQPPAQTAAPEQEVTIVGCVQREADYRRAQNLGGGGAAGTGMGAGNEFVLVDASMSTGATASAPTTGTAAGTATGTAGSSAPGSAANAYELTGKNEGQAEQFVGRRVEVVGKLKAAETTATGTTGGATAGAPPRGVDVMSKDLKLREFDVTSVRETTGSCPATPR